MSESLKEQDGKSSTVKLCVFCWVMSAWKDPSHTSSRKGTVEVGILKANQMEVSF